MLPGLSFPLIGLVHIENINNSISHFKAILTAWKQIAAGDGMIDRCMHGENRAPFLLQCHKACCLQNKHNGRFIRKTTLNSINNKVEQCVPHLQLFSTFQNPNTPSRAQITGASSGTGVCTWPFPFPQPLTPQAPDASNDTFL